MLATRAFSSADKWTKHIFSWFHLFQFTKKVNQSDDRKFTYVNQKLRKENEVWQSYCKNKTVQYFAPTRLRFHERHSKVYVNVK